MKKCSCCGVTYSFEEFQRLPLKGVKRSESGYPDLEMRNCSCDNTLAWEIPKILSLETVVDDTPCRVCGTQTADRKRVLSSDTVLCAQPSACVTRSMERAERIRQADLAADTFHYHEWDDPHD